MKRFTNKLFFNRSLFRKQLLSYFITVLIPTLMILTIYSYTIVEDLTSEIKQASDNSTQNVTKSIEDLTEQIDYFSLRLSFLPDLNRMLKDPTGIMEYDKYQLKEQVRNQIVSSQLFYSVYIYSTLNKRFMTSGEGFFDADSFYDKPVLEQIQTRGNESFWYQVRDDYITFYKAIPVTETKPLGFVVINVQKDMFLSTINNLSNGNEQNVFIVDNNAHVITSSNGDNTSVIDHLIAEKAGSTSNEMQKISLNQQTFFANIQHVKGNSWTVVSLIPYDIYIERLIDKMSKILIMVIVVFAIGLVIAYTFAVKMYNPWKKMLEVLFGSENNNQISKDEFLVVSGAISSMKDTIKQNEPIMKDHLISDILRNNVSNIENISDRLEQVGILFTEPYYLVIIAVFDEMRSEDAENPQHKLIIYSMVSEILKKNMLVEGTILDRNKLGFIVNLPHSSMDEALRQQIHQCYAEMNTAAQEQLNISLQLVVSGISTTEQLHTAYEQIRRMLNYKAVINRNDVVMIQDYKNEFKFVYPSSLQKQLIHAVTSMNREKANQCVSDLFNQYMYKTKYPLEKIQGMVVVLLSSVFNELLKEGHDIEGLYEDVDIFKLNECQNNDELNQLMITNINKLIAFLEGQQDKQVMNLYVTQAIRIIEEHYVTNISITEIADRIGISSGHLSRIFKIEMGKPMLEYLNEYRIKKSKELLSQRSDSLQEIGLAVGYNDVHSFIRFFKKYEGMTPGDYRKTIKKN
ncbi:AraC family transcriptional regulator [Paenibacillus oryzisoli]|uniref:AraC family transcriptional regulator n=1 Tax=Paenibacillus oryzisoli TaxID=1850517 RepID=UPI003D26AADA